MPKSIFGKLSVIAVIVAVFGGFSFAGYYYFREENILPARELRIAHFYNDPETSIEKIGLRVFYAVPKNREKDFDQKWRGKIDPVLLRASRFHFLELRGLSELDYKLFPQPVFLEHDDPFYSTSTDGGNPRALIAIAEEIDRRVFGAGGDLYDPEFAKFEEGPPRVDEPPRVEAGEYPAMGIIYEGVGASGGIIYKTEEDLTRAEIAMRLGVPESMVFLLDIESVRGFFILNYEFLSDKEFSVFGPTYLYHEFGHSYGLPDRDEAAPFSVDSPQLGEAGDQARFEANKAPPGNDIMGYGRKEPLEVMYIGRDLLKGLGVID